MNYSKQDQLEACVERHRADFDLHEPRPELWAALEKQLHDSSGEHTASVMSVVGASADESPQLPAVPLEQPAPRKQWAWAEYYSIAAALAVLILAAGLGEAWKSGQVTKERAVANAAAELPTNAEADAALYLGQSGELMASEVSHNTNARLDTAVRGMETYYVGQLADRKAELGQLSPEAVAECSRELVDLDSLYQQLKRELPSHPQPEVVLTAMNRNLQYRLDILNRQLELRNPTQAGLVNETRGEYALADSRRASASILHHDH
ncbi:hypothetical protein FNT36_09795 [Hymenobacter setariae]|uniref:Anti-sigma factor n=1 Tax=Hymenobacter setariae TaxID=2594794 RepID=A0A558BYW9_9BACT|nr:hypothetical protein [Hymenobacter setariae]TVT41711.1 hypothetical protein FNT36_09795 [Hymenobacter setariae]